MPILQPRSKLYVEEHQRHVAYHGRRSAEHEARRELEAVARHRTAIEAHEKAAAAPFDDALSGAAMRASAIADEVSQRVRRARRRG